MLNTPILFLIFNRPEATQQVFAAIRNQRPKFLYIGADGPRNIPGEHELSLKCREIATAIDWDCEVKTLFRTNNLGAKYAVSSAITWFFSHEEYGIILEDDCLPGAYFFPFCEELLLRYRKVDRIMHITGSNLNDRLRYGDGTYYLSQYPNVWGWATWKRAWEKMDLELTETELYLSIIKKKFSSYTEKLFWISRLSLCKANQVDSWDYPWMFSIWKANGVCLNTNYNFVSNIGFGPDSTHTKGKSIYITPEVKNGGDLRHPSTEVIRADAEADFIYQLHGIKRQNRFAFYFRKYFIQRCLNLVHKLKIMIQK